MIAPLGEFVLAGAVLVAAGALLAATGAARLRSERLLRVSRIGIGGVCFLFLVAAGILLYALLENRFELSYVAEYSESGMPVAYKIAALWAGQQGSILLWAVMVGVMSLIAVAALPKGPLTQRAVTTAILALICGFFAALLVFAADPFVLFNNFTPAEGRGLNPMLQNPAMAFHPPLLFLGYAGFTIPFAYMVGALVAKREDNHWLAPVRRWVLFSWITLTAGIALGAWWAYVELGWGGYWAWDPVENASILPWLTATAMIHSIIAQQRRGSFKRWNASLIAATFVLCVFGTYLTRSGVISSVHAFPASVLGEFFLVFILFSIAASTVLIAVRWRTLRPEHQIEGLVSREGAFLLGNILLVLMMLTVLIGTIFPIISRSFLGHEITVTAPFYNRVVLPMGFAVVALMALGPALPFGHNIAPRVIRALTIPAVLTASAVLIALGIGVRSGWTLASIAVVVIGTSAVIIDFARASSARRRSTGEAWPVAMIHLLDRDHRRYGGQTAHLGMMMLSVGVVASGLFSREIIHRLSPGQTESFAGFDITLKSFDQVRGPNYDAVEATVELVGRGETLLLTPQRRFYDTWSDDPNSEVAIASNWKQDVYLSLAGWEENGAIVGIQTRINPGVAWLWIGSIVLVFGGAVSMMPPFLPRARPAASTAQPRSRSNNHIANAKAQAPRPVLTHPTTESVS